MSKDSKKLSGWISLSFFTTLFVMSGVIVTFLIRDVKQCDLYHQQISYHTIYSVSYELEAHFKSQQRLANLVTFAYQTPITEWINDLENPEKYQAVKTIITRFFPNHYSFTLANSEGHAIWDDLGETIGEKCLTELYEYTHSSPTLAHPTRPEEQRYHISTIHPAPSSYHYDVFVPIAHLGEAKTLLISFEQKNLIEILANRQSVNHRLMIIDEKNANLIELTGSGGRDTIPRAFNLSDEENALIQSGIGGKKTIAHTRWSVVDMIDPAVRDQKYHQMIIGISITALTTLLLALIGDFSLSRYRYATEAREKILKENNQSLEREVHKRTALLTEQKAQLKLAANVFEQSSEGIIITDANHLIVEVNQAMIHITGFNRNDLIGQSPNILHNSKSATDFYLKMWESLESYDCWHGELEEFNTKKHHQVTMQCAISVVRDDQGNITNYIAIYTNITPLKTAQRALENMAYYDRLTGLPNRSRLFERLEAAIIDNQRHHTLLAVCYMDLDGFKAVNDHLGHDAGDLLLNLVAIRLTAILRPEDTIARLGGDEFVVLISQLNDRDAVKPVLAQIMKQIQEPFLIQETNVTIGVSIGVSFYPEHGDDTDQLLRSADQAMYQIKRSGKNNIAYADAL